MPKKRNFLGGMQNYDPKTGEYEPDLKGPDGERPSDFKNFKKGDEKKSQHDKINAKRMGAEPQISDNVARKEMKMLRDGIIEKEQLDELKETFKGKDYEEALRQVDEGRPFGEVLSGLVRYEEYDEDKSFEATNEKRMNGKENLKNKIEEWKKNNPDGKVEENVDIESLKKEKHDGIAGELESLDFTMDKVDEENQILEFKGKRGNYKIVQSKDNPANYETYLNDELVMKGQGSAYIAGNIKKYDNDDDFVERVKAKNKELDAQDKSFGNINKKRMGNDKLPF